MMMELKKDNGFKSSVVSKPWISRPLQLEGKLLLKKGECHDLDLGLRPCKGEQLGLRALVVGPYEPV